MTVEEVNKRFDGFAASIAILSERSKRCINVDNEVGAIQAHTTYLESEVVKLKEEISTIKNQANIKTRVASVIDTMTPFATRPAQPTGSNK